MESLAFYFFRKNRKGVNFLTIWGGFGWNKGNNGDRLKPLLKGILGSCLRGSDGLCDFLRDQQDSLKKNERSVPAYRK
jgi:hypothetical protein